MKKEDWGNILNYLNLAGATLDNIPENIETADDETILDLLKQSVEMDQKTWVLQSYLLFFKHENAAKKNKLKIIKETATSINMTKSKAYDLLKIYKYILQYDIDLAKLPFLTQNHFIIAIRNLAKIEEQGLNPIDLLKKANDETWTSVELDNNIKGKVTRYTKDGWYQVMNQSENEPNLIWENDGVALYNNITLYTAKTGEQYLKIKQYDDTV